MGVHLMQGAEPYNGTGDGGCGIPIAVNELQVIHLLLHEPQRLNGESFPWMELCCERLLIILSWCIGAIIYLPYQIGPSGNVEEALMESEGAGGCMPLS